MVGPLAGRTESGAGRVTEIDEAKGEAPLSGLMPEGGAFYKHQYSYLDMSKDFVSVSLLNGGCQLKFKTEPERPV